jgi:hypothetical protein
MTKDASAVIEELKNAILLAYTSKHHVQRLINLARKGKSKPMNILAGGKFGTLALNSPTSAGGDASYAYAIAGEQQHKRNNPDLRNLS